MSGIYSQVQTVFILIIRANIEDYTLSVSLSLEGGEACVVFLDAFAFLGISKNRTMIKTPYTLQYLSKLVHKMLL